MNNIDYQAMVKKAKGVIPASLYYILAHAEFVENEEILIRSNIQVQDTTSLQALESFVFGFTGALKKVRYECTSDAIDSIGGALKTQQTNIIKTDEFLKAFSDIGANIEFLAEENKL